MADCRTFYADGCAAGSLLGGGYDSRNHPILARCSAHCVLAALCWHRSWSARWRNCGQLLPITRARIRDMRVHSGIAFRGGTLGPKRISIWRCYAGDCALDTKGEPSLASRFPSVRRSFHRNWSCADIRVGMAGKGSHALRVSEFFVKANAANLAPWIAMCVMSYAIC